MSALDMNVILWKMMRMTRMRKKTKMKNRIRDRIDHTSRFLAVAAMQLDVVFERSWMRMGGMNISFHWMRCCRKFGMHQSMMWTSMKNPMNRNHIRKNPPVPPTAPRNCRFSPSCVVAQRDVLVSRENKLVNGGKENKLCSQKSKLPHNLSFFLSFFPLPKKSTVQTALTE